MKSSVTAWHGIVVLSLPVRGAWIEIALGTMGSRLLWSLPVRGAWIEIRDRLLIRWRSGVAPRAGRVDGNP